MRSSLSSLPSCGKWAWSDLRNQPASGRIFAYPVIQVPGERKGRKERKRRDNGGKVRMEMLIPKHNPLSSALTCMDSHMTDLPSIKMHILSLTQWSRRRRQNKCRRCPLVNISDTDNAAITLYIVVRLTFSRFYATTMGKQGKLEPPDTDYLPEQKARPFLPYTGSPCAGCAFCTSCPCRTYFSPWGYSPSCCIESVIEAMIKRWSRGASESSQWDTQIWEVPI